MKTYQEMEEGYDKVLRCTALAHASCKDNMVSALLK
ncbi:hypothetical protein ADUPG1_014423, partial [Aduncisulcus paluster]